METWDSFWLVNKASRLANQILKYVIVLTVFHYDYMIMYVFSIKQNVSNIYHLLAFQYIWLQ